MKMKIIIALGITSSILAYSHNQYFDYDHSFPIYDTGFHTHSHHHDFTSYVLRVRFPRGIKKTPPLCGYYKGYRLRFDVDYCLINEKTPVDAFTLIITNEVHRRWQKNTTRDLKRVAGKPCRMFYITKKHDGTCCTWNVEEVAKKNIPLVLPKTAIVLVFDPKLIDTLKNSDDLMKIKTPKQDSLYLPIIELKADITQEQLNKATDHAWCGALDTRGVHSPVSSSVKNGHSCIACVTRLQR